MDDVCIGHECKAKAFSLCPYEMMTLSRCMSMSRKARRKLKKGKYWILMRRSEAEYHMEAREKGSDPI